jgi:small subunit ribosomal protein S10
MKSMGKQASNKKIRIRLKGFDQRVLDRSTLDIIETAKRTGARVVGPIPLPSKREIYTVLRSPHIDRKSREQFEMRTHIRVLDIINPTSDTIDKLKILPVAAGVDIKIKAA